ncbi:MAG: LamG domain-containing protein, partial [Patescibacteria group bacterium]|nr:LamG domain-containing protein [Patescibacteria group bacterium]
ESGNNNTGTIYGGASQTKGVIGKALSFDGVDDYVNLTGISFNNGGNLSIVLWANFSVYDGNDYIVDIELGRLLIGLYGNNFNFYDDAWKNYGAGIACAPYLNNWHYYVFTFDSVSNPDIAKLYIDGKLMGSNNTYSAKNISGAITLMSRYSRDSYFTRGLVDDVRIYSTALTRACVQQLYAQGLETHQNLAVK